MSSEGPSSYFAALRRAYTMGGVRHIGGVFRSGGTGNPIITYGVPGGGFRYPAINYGVPGYPGRYRVGCPPDAISLKDKVS